MFKNFDKQLLNILKSSTRSKFTPLNKPNFFDGGATRLDFSFGNIVRDGKSKNRNINQLMRDRIDNLPLHFSSVPRVVEGGYGEGFDVREKEARKRRNEYVDNLNKIHPNRFISKTFENTVNNMLKKYPSSLTTIEKGNTPVRFFPKFYTPEGNISEQGGLYALDKREIQIPLSGVGDWLPENLAHEAKHAEQDRLGKFPNREVNYKSYNDYENDPIEVEAREAEEEVTKQYEYPEYMNIEGDKGRKLKGQIINKVLTEPLIKEDEQSQNMSVLSRMADKATLYRTYSPTYKGSTIQLPPGHSKSINLMTKQIMINYPEMELPGDRMYLNEEILFRKQLKQDPSRIFQEIRNYNDRELNEDTISVNRTKQYKVAGKPVIVKSKLPVKLKTIEKVYNVIPDDTSIPIVFQTKKQYLKEYIKNQEAKHNIDYPVEQEKQYINSELVEYQPILSRYTTKHNPYMEPRVVFFTENKFSPKDFKATAWHEYGHEDYEKKLKLGKVDKLSRNKEEMYADKVMLKHIGKDELSRNKEEENKYFYHITTPNAIKSIKESGLKQSKKGYSGRGVYLADTPNNTLGYYINDFKDGVLLRVGRDELFKKFGRYKNDNEGLVQYDKSDTTGEVLVQTDIPKDMLEQWNNKTQKWELLNKDNQSKNLIPSDMIFRSGQLREDSEKMGMKLPESVYEGVDTIDRLSLEYSRKYSIPIEEMRELVVQTTDYNIENEDDMRFILDEEIIPGYLKGEDISVTYNKKPSLPSVMPMMNLFFAGNMPPSKHIELAGYVLGFGDIKFAFDWKEQNNYGGVWKFTTDNYQFDTKQYIRHQDTGMEMSDDEYKCFNVLNEQQVR